MVPPLVSLHHVTATVAEAAPDVDFYRRILGLRLVKKTVNFDNPSVYHLYYGDALGRPSTLMTTFPYAGRAVRQGIQGAGQITLTAFSIPPGSLDFWRDRLTAEGLDPEPALPRFQEEALLVRDPSGLQIELREGAGDTRPPWPAEGIPDEAAIRGVHSVTFTVREGAPTVHFALEALGLELVDRAGPLTRLAAGEPRPGHLIDVLEAPDAPEAVNGLGTVHHLALAARDDADQLAFQRALRERGVQVTEVRDRQYFRSIYFREPGGILYEIATLGPGFTVDEAPDALGTSLRLPPTEEDNRAQIEARLAPLPPAGGEQGSGGAGPHAGSGS